MTPSECPKRIAPDDVTRRAIAAVESAFPRLESDGARIAAAVVVGLVLGVALEPNHVESLMDSAEAGKAAAVAHNCGFEEGLSIGRAVAAEDLPAGAMWRLDHVEKEPTP